MHVPEQAAGARERPHRVADRSIPRAHMGDWEQLMSAAGRVERRPGTADAGRGTQQGAHLRSGLKLAPDRKIILDITKEKTSNRSN